MNPYRKRAPRPDPQGDPSPERAAAYRASRVRLLLAAALIAGGAAALPWIARRHRTRLPGFPVPDELLTAASAFPAATPPLPPAVPLAPLLAADTPDRLALLEPADAALNVRPGDPITLRFNRPMVDGVRVDKPAVDPVIAFTPEVRGRGRWTSRSSYSFEADPGTWAATRTTTMILAPSLRSLAGEAIEEAEPRTVVFDAGPRFVSEARSRRLLPGEPLRLLFSGKVEPQALSSQMMVYEVDGGRRMIPFSITGKAADARGRTPVDIALRRALEPGAHLAVALAPPLSAGGAYPRVVEAELSPRPRIEGIGCPLDAKEASQCSFSGPPGEVVDVGESLVLLATEDLGDVKAGALEVRPALGAMTTKVDGKRLIVGGDWVPGQVYEVRVGEIADKQGHALARTAPLAVRSSGRAPEVHAPSGRLAFERDAITAIRLQGIHVEGGEVRLGPVPAGQEIEAVLAPARWIDDDRKGAWTSLPLHDLLPESKPNRWGRGSLDWQAADAAHGSMAVVSIVPDAAHRAAGARPATFVERTDLGIDAELLQAGALVWVTSVSSARPVTGAHVTVRGLAGPSGADAGAADAGAAPPESVDGVTDDHGVAWIAAPEGSTWLAQGAAIRAAQGDDRAVVVVDPRSSMAPRHLGTTPGEAPPSGDRWVATVFTDRGICRPGETIHAKAMVRASVGGEIASPTGGDARLLLFGPTGQAPLDERLVALSPFGTADADFPIGDTTGAYRVEVRVPGQDEPAGSVSFQVGDYSPPTFRVDLSTERQQLDDHDPLKMEILARRLFGPPAAGMRARWTLIREPDGDYPDRWADFTFGPVDASSRRGTVASGEVVLDAEGHAAVETTVSLGAPIREEALFEVTVRDVSGLDTTARRRVHTYPAALEIGLRRAPLWIDRGAALDVAAVVIDHDGAPQPSRKIDARILREGWHTYWEWSGRGGDDAGEGGDEGSFQPRRARRAEVAHRCQLTSATDPVRCSWTPDRPGTYVIEVTTKDDEGRTSTASQRVYVAGPDEHPDRDPPGTALTLTPESSDLRAGETAKIAFESPFPDAEALITVEREGVIHTEERRVAAGGNVIRFQVTPEMVPNAFVSLSLVRPRTGPPGAKVDLDAPDLRVGMTEIQVRPATSPLTVKIEVEGKSAPARSDVPVTVSVADAEAHGVAAEVALFAVDEGTLRVTGYAVPDPTEGLFPRRPAAFAWEDLRRWIQSRVDPLAAAAGGDGDSAPDRARPRDEQERFDPTPLWLAHLTTDAAGEARAVLHLPSRPTEYRIMAVAVDGGIRSGHAERSILASMPVVVRPVLPRFVTSGDRFEAAAFVHNTEDAAADVTVTPVVGGVPRAARVLHLPAKGEARVAEPVEAGAPGTLGVRFEARSAAGATAAELKVPVEPRGRTVRTEGTFAVSGSREITVALPEGAEDGSLSLTVAAHPFVGFDMALESLLAEPDAGVEPTASSVIGLAAYAVLDTGKRPSSVRPEELRARAATAIARLASLEGPSGGFGAYAAGDTPDPYLTAYALHALLAARTAGLSVPAPAVDRAVAYLGQLARGSDLLDKGNHDDLAFALRVLAEGGARDDDRDTALFEQRERLSPYGLSELSLALDPSDRRRDTLIVDAATRVLATADDERKDPKLLRWYDGSARTLGAVLEASVAIDVAAGYAAPLCAKILASRAAPEAAWWSEHETSHALAALAAYAATLKSGDPIAPHVALDGVPIEASEASADLASFALPRSTDQGSHTLRIEVQGTAYFAISARYGVPLGPEDDVARGETAALHRVLEDQSGKPLGPGAHVRLGDLVRVRLFLYTEQDTPPYLTVRDRLAGGLEPIDEGHETTPRESLWALLGMGPDDDAVDVRGHYAARTLDQITHRSFLPTEAVFHLASPGRGLREITYGARATTVGTFVLPPAEIEALYAPRFLARSAAAAITVDP